MTATQLEQLTLITVNPATLQVRDQARGDATPDDALIASVKAHGIIQPPVVEATEDGDGYVIVAGHRRVGAAIAAGIAEITVIARPHGASSEALTLEQQIIENERRKALTAQDLAAGYQKLSLFGLRPEDIAAGLGEKPERVRAGLKINTSDRARELVETATTIDFEQAATIADFDEHPKIQKRLIETATTRPENFARDVEVARGERAVEQKLTDIKAALAAEGVPFIEAFTYSQHGWTKKGGMYGGPGAVLDALADPTDPGQQLTAHTHADCPGRGAYVHKASAYYLDTEDAFEVVHVCTDWKANGHTKWQRPAEDKTPEEIEREEEFARRRAESDRLNAERAQRQAIITANTRARRTWLHNHLNTGRLRPTASHLDILALAASAQIREQDGPPVHVALELLTGTPHERGGWNSTENEEKFLALQGPQISSLRLVLALAIAYLDDAAESADGEAYFAELTSWGYTLTDTDREHLAAAATARSELLSAGQDDGDDEAADA